MMLGGNAWAKPVELTVLHTNDTHDHLEAFDTHGAKDVGGVARRATLFKQVRTTTQNVLVLDAGDVFQGTPLFTFFSGEPDYATLGECGYDAVTVGNHDMDNGLANLRKQAKLLSQPLLSCNLVDEQGKLLFQPYRIIERGGLKIAVVGVMSENAYEAIAEDRRKGVKLLDPTATLKQVLPGLRKQADLVVLLSHSGYEEELAYARDLQGVDLVVGGHSHTKVDHPVAVQHDGRVTLVVQAFQWGQYVGRIDLTVDDGRIQSYKGELLPVTDEIKEDPTVAATVGQYAKQIAAKMNEVVGKSAVEFANGNKSNGDAPIGNLISDVLREEGGADVALMNSGGIRSSLPQGNLTRGMIFSMLPFENRLVTIKCNAAQLQQIIDFTAAKVGKSGSLQVSGVSFGVTPDGHATDVRVGGKPLDARRTYTVATIDYIANGNDGADVFKQFKDVHATGQLAREVFFDYLKKHPVLQQPEGGRIKVVAGATTN